MSPPKDPGIIRKLDETVVNRIAAGEVIQRPANAIKELLENSLDAGATNITIVVANGGLQLLQINDNGSGIRKEDLDIVCERFTTSKLKEFNDLAAISTYGFRGEALSSISHVSKLTILTKTQGQACGYKVEYLDGKPQTDKPKACAANQGTQITVQDLFYNVPTRKRVLKSASDEFNRIADVVSKYAIHNSGKSGFTLKKVGDAYSDLRTQVQATVQDNIAVIYTPAISRELLEFQHEDKPLKFKVKGYMTNPNYSVKKMTFLLFINHRLVESSALKRSIEQIYTTYLPKGSYPFVYLSLEIAAANVDVNVHPTKHEVHFLHQDEIIEKIQQKMDAILIGSNKSRTFKTQAVLPGVSAQLPIVEKRVSEAPKNMVRTDAKEQKLDKFLVKNVTVFDKTHDFTAASNSTESQKLAEETELMNVSDNAGDYSRSANFTSTQKPEQNVANKKAEFEAKFGLKDTDVPSKIPSKNSEEVSDMDIEEFFHGTTPPEPPEPPKKMKFNEPIEDIPKPKKSSLREKYENLDSSRLGPKSGFLEPPKESMEKLPSGKKKKEIKLQSIKSLLQQIDDNCAESLKDIIANHTFVGCASREFALIQHTTKLYVVNIHNLTKNFFYQLMLEEFGNADIIKLDPAPSVKELALLALNLEEVGWTPEDGNKEDIAQNVEDLLMDKSEMLDDYFSLKIENGLLHSLPMLLDDFIPDLNGVPLLLLRLATEVNWDEEEECFHTFCSELSRFYAMRKISQSSYDVQQHFEQDGDWKKVAELVVFPAMKKMLKPSKILSDNKTFNQVADLPELYKVFERC